MTCPVCAWTDEALDSAFARNQLHEAQRAYVRTGACAPAFASLVRPPRADEVRAPDWEPLPGVHEARSRREQAAAAIADEIEAAFAEVTPSGRVALLEAYRADYLAAPPADAPINDWEDQDEAWTQLPAWVLDYFANCTNVFVFGNARSFHYYLPAYMIRDLQCAELVAVDAVLGADDEALALLDARQREAVRLYLEHLLDFIGPTDRVDRAKHRIELAG